MDIWYLIGLTAARIRYWVRGGHVVRPHYTFGGLIMTKTKNDGRFEAIRYRPKNAKTERTYVSVQSGTTKPTWLPLPQALAILDNADDFAAAVYDAIPMEQTEPEPAAPHGMEAMAQALAALQQQLAGLTGATAKPAAPQKTSAPKAAPLSGAAARVRSARR